MADRILAATTAALYAALLLWLLDGCVPSDCARDPAGPGYVCRTPPHEPDPLWWIWTPW